ncbi:pumilio homolog 6, chloroplastic [Cannabis sativa]|uniref:pumilio homolog 6, chloroplastic n=1 Tax=Cannabis sativa TaxID=3483 RepID=UPI0011DF3AE4|nr:pumilio homolog 6, chloroplastic [Cannabis sativa]XP_060973289.1 pumilio homolog 6, chloroplastic [Cannabis sativa]XP_060973290.1 pumilio homolog 6, chloroplastic [Cannabis sativa]
MATESPIRMSETSGKWASHKKASTFAQSSAGMAAEDLKLLLKGHRFTGSGKDVAPSRSGSAPPSIEGSFLSVSNIFSQQNFQTSESMASLNIDIGKYESEEQLRADPAYFSYYCSNVNMNPRLPPPLISWENRRLVRHIGSFGNNWGLTSVDDSGNVSLHMAQGSLPTHKEEPEDDHSPQQPSNSGVDRTGEIWSGQDTISMADQHKVAGSLSQDDFSGSSLPEYASSHGITEESANCDAGSNSFYGSPIITPNVNASNLGTEEATNTDPSVAPVSSSSSVDSIRSSGGDESGINIMGSEMKALAISNSPTSSNQANQEQWQQSNQNIKRPQKMKMQNNLSLPQSAKSHITTQGFNCTHNGVDQHLHSPCKFSAEVQPVLQSSGFTPPLYASAAAYMTSTNPFYSNMQAPGFFNAQFLGGYAVNPNAFPPYVPGYPPGPVPLVVDGTAGLSFNTRTTGVPNAGAIPPGADVPNLNKFYGQIGFPIQPSFVDPMYMQYHQQPFGEPYSIPGPFDPLAARAGVVGGQVNMPDLKNGSDNAVYMDEHKIQHQRGASNANLNPRRGGTMSPNYFGNTSNVGVLMHYPTSPLPSPVLPGSPGGGNGLSRGRAETRFPPGTGRNAGMYSGWPGQRGFEIFDDPKMYNFLEELKSGKGRRFELSDIIGHIVEFSSDQHGSRFIQQKLENCSVEEKASVFKEVLPHASKLMTDVFGNYVIQKFFEYGSHDQRKELANQLRGQILPLSLQMYGCRVIQKALEVIDLEQKAQLVRELDGHVMRCVRDQNGNHVIQKCIESIPTEKIAFIISAFRGQVATLSMHPYGCRVIQRVLEHCTDELQCQFIVDEILESVCTLAQDQYGNYVTQHVLERGKANERSLIISKLSGHVVQLSQHKFASNVIEKCLEHGGPADRELLINEVVGHNEGNDNLLTMMKDQYANYVVQKTLEICTDSQRIVLLNGIRSHAHALKKYTYGKHIVARFEQVFGDENQT